jgi:hypothetical protein
VRQIRGHEIVIGALVATAFWALIYVLTSNAASHYEICETAKEGTKECASYNIISFAFRKIVASLDILSALITAIATILIALFTFTLKRSTDSLWEAGERQRLLSEDTAKRQLRAYIGLVRNDMNFERHEFIIVVKNSGQTPGMQVTPFFNMQWYVPGSDMPADFAFADYPQNPGSGPIFMTPGQEHPVRQIRILGRFRRSLGESILLPSRQISRWRRRVSRCTPP